MLTILTLQVPARSSKVQNSFNTAWGDEIKAPEDEDNTGSGAKQLRRTLWLTPEMKLTTLCFWPRP